MLVLRVELNGVVVATAGASDLSVVTAIVIASGRLGSASNGTELVPHGYEAELNVSGMFSAEGDGPTEHADWGPTRALSAGDQIAIHVQESDTADEPHRRRTTVMNEAQERAQFERVRAMYLKLRAKYEDGVDEKE